MNQQKLEKIMVSGHLQGQEVIKDIFNLSKKIQDFNEDDLGMLAEEN